MMEEPKVDVDALKVEVVAHYAAGVHGLYSQSLASAKVMDTAIDAFIADPESGQPGSGQTRVASRP